MESLIVFGLLVLIGLVVVGALLPTRPTPQIIYLVAESPQARGRAGCLPALLIVVALVVVVWLAVGA